MGGRACSQQGRRTLVVLNDHAVRPSRLRSSTASRTARRARPCVTLQPVQIPFEARDRGDRRAGHRHELGQRQRQLPADPVPQRPDRGGRPGARDGPPPRRHLALVCFLHQAWRDTLDQAVDMYGELLDRNRKLVEGRLDDMLKAQRQAVDRIVQHYRRLGAAACRLMCRSTSRHRRCSRSSAVMA